ncbi:hypothetical protein KUTeg_004051 [Tegillarca granosa]|uniref:Uncharacterized protein n=1 Tax=Tegillarca granosa TaxID=220873 RepID=A0ABQ9FTC8_TEGGR|nr:hypothetical protein KUTeg_004051 [Tegillarca granosa]
MTILSLSPSEIRYTQDSIGTTFGRSTRHAFQPIGQTLDDLLKGRCSIYTIPSISVTWKNGKVYSADNRRLWIFKKAEELGSCNSIPVREIDDYYISSMKWTTVNDGESLYVRGDPGGSYWKTLKPRPIFKHHIIEMRKNEINRNNQAHAVDINTGKDVSIKGDDKEKEKTDKMVSEEKQKINNGLNNGDAVIGGCDNKAYLYDDPSDLKSTAGTNNQWNIGYNIKTLDIRTADNYVDTSVTGNGATLIESNHERSSSDSESITIEDNLSNIKTLDTEESNALGTPNYKETDSSCAVVNIDIETNKNVDYSFNVQKPKRKSCCVRNKCTILTFVIICILYAILIDLILFDHVCRFQIHLCFYKFYNKI